MKENIERLLSEGVEVIVVDNNSQDCSKEVLRSFTNIIYKINEKLIGQSANRNWMIKQAHGKYILLLDSDILYQPKSFDYLIQRLQNAPENVKCVGFDPWIYANDKTLIQKCLPSIEEPLSEHGQPIAYTQYGVFDRDIFYKYNIWFDENFGTGYGAEDNDLALQMLQRGLKCVCVPFRYYHNKHTKHWFDLHQPDIMRVQERNEYLEKKWGHSISQQLYGYKPETIPKVMIGVGICPRTKYARDLFMEWVSRQTYPNIELYIDENRGEENARASRQRIRDQFLKSNCQYLLFCDVDTIPPDDAINKLISHKKDIVSGITVARLDPNVLAFWKNNYTQEQKKELIKNKELIEIDGAGLYCVLISRPVLELILFDWNSIVDDVEFYTRAKMAGYQIYLDPSVSCKHYRDNKNYYTI
ncbi:MAG: glycosyltransferase [Candidatus Anstonellales archaeon]